MTTRELIKTGFKELVQVKAFNKITVADICEQSHVSRNTFYFHFTDRNALIEQCIQDDLLRPIEELRALFPTKKYKSAPKMVVEQFHLAVYEHRDFYEKLISQDGGTTVLIILVTKLSELNRQILSESTLSKIEAEYMAYFYASAHSMLILKWIRDKWIIEPKDMTDYFYKWALQFWASGEVFKNEWAS